MSYLIFIVLAILSIIKKKNKFITLAWIVFLVILATFNTTVADRDNYISMYVNTTSYNSVYFQRIEPGLRLLILGGHFLHLSYFQFYFIYFSLVLLLYVYAVKRYTEDVNLVLLLFAIFPFALEATQLRGMLANVIVLFSIRFLEKRNLKNILAFLICIFLAGMVHNVAFFFIILGLKFFTWNKRRFIFANIILALAGLLLLFNGSVSSFLGRFVYSTRGYSYLEGSSIGIRRTLDCILIVVLLGISAYMYFLTHMKDGKYTGMKYTKNLTKGKVNKYSSLNSGAIWEIQFYTSTLSLWVIPMIALDQQFYRLIRPFVMIFYLAFASFLNSKKREMKVNLSNGVYILTFFLFLLLFVYIDCGGVFSKTYLPIMNDNLIIP